MCEIRTNFEILMGGRGSLDSYVTYMSDHLLFKTNNLPVMYVDTEEELRQVVEKYFPFKSATEAEMAIVDSGSESDPDKSCWIMTVCGAVNVRAKPDNNIGESMCEETKCEDCKCEAPAPAAPAFDMFAEQSNANDEIGQTILNSISKIAEGVLTLQQEIVLLGERVEAHEAHLSFLLMQNPKFTEFFAEQQVAMKEAAVAASQTGPKTES